MSDYIKREDAVCVALAAKRLGNTAYSDRFEIASRLRYLPTADVVERPRWIPVTERLPEEHIRVLVVNDDAKFMVAERYADDWWYQYSAYDVDRWDALEQGVITHWMPLPEPPKEVDT